ncbi:MAG: hypothetical protein AB1847_19670 [bacterium]
MARVTYDSDIKNLAFHTWRKLGQNIDAAARELDKLGYAITRPTLYSWAEQLGWRERAQKADAEEAQMQATRLSQREKALRDLITQKERYDAYFSSSQEIDNRATYAYTSIVKAIAELEKSLHETGDVLFSAPAVMEEFVTFVQTKVKDRGARESILKQVDAFLQGITP